VGNRDICFTIFRAHVVYDGVTTLGELVAAAPKMSLKAQGLLGKPTIPCSSLRHAGHAGSDFRAYLLLDSGDVPKEAWINPKGGHLGGQVKVCRSGHF